ncbi:hypothetical protein BD289DRAFT_509295 [Coniella lustricola]|uniref:RING-type E3 ubiquitin transferase n=1 Tax=Coniella lustricola TaxID=2025994 RepID=A0A2T2ZVF3_9PEZI|nr:hypothetical protein BD289DRAFT_509295 [Coniella lustricola]
MARLHHLGFTLALACTSLLTLAQADAAVVFPMSTAPEGELRSEMQLAISTADANSTPQLYTVLPLSLVLGFNETEADNQQVVLTGNLTLADATTYPSISGADVIPYLSCDQTNNSFIQPDTILNQLMSNDPQPAAIVLYSQQEQFCGLTGQSLVFNRIFSMAGMQVADEIVNLTMASAAGAVVRATITGNLTGDGDGRDGSRTNDSTNNNSTITMTVLYSITAIVTILFVGIIVMGAIRAHRYPERYGPRAALLGGGARQSRAKGLARAVLETLPVVKFGGDAQQQLHISKGDIDVELENAAHDSRGAVDAAHREEQDQAGGHLGSDSEHHSPIAAAIPTGRTASPPRDGAYKNNLVTAGNEETPHGGIHVSGGAANDHSNGTGNDDSLVCSICTDDFTVGEDVRVLPCNHKFHPQCVDPWLVNVSGTCPLCRLDLRSGNTDDSAQGSSSTNDAADVPPLSADGNEPLTATMTGGASSGGGDDSVAGIRRRSRLFDIARLRHASAEERIEGLRRFRQGSFSAASAGAATAAATQRTDAETMHRTRLSDRLRERFHVRTRAA